MTTAPARALPPSSVVHRVVHRVGAAVESRWTVPLAAVLVVLLRLPGLSRPVRADEAGFLLVARSWDPSPDSVYGRYFVDRPPLLIEVFRLSDLLGGPLFIRVLGALAAALLVVAAARTARLVAGERAAGWVAVAVAAMSANTLIDAVAVKGELLGVPFVMAGCWLSLLALRRDSAALAFLAGVLACTAVGFKQNLAGGLAFAGALLLASLLTRAVAPGTFARLALAGLAGAATPVAATVAWAWSQGVRLDVLWYAVYGFRSDAAAALAGEATGEPATRLATLVLSAVGAGMLLIVAGFVVHVRGEWAGDPALTAATATLVLFDLTALVLGGSFWRDYLLALLPATALCAALLVRHGSRRGLRMRAVILGAAASTVVCLLGWVVIQASGLQEFDEVRTGQAVGRAAAPGDTMVVFGGRADLQLASSMASPYEHLWSLPMRTLDPDLAELAAVVAGPERPTWIVEWVDFTTWSPAGGAALADLVGSEYVAHGAGCGDTGRTVWLLRGVERPAVTPDCG